jgi:hypothetical protein
LILAYLKLPGQEQQMIKTNTCVTSKTKPSKHEMYGIKTNGAKTKRIQAKQRQTVTFFLWNKKKLTKAQRVQTKITRARQYIWNKRWVKSGRCTTAKLNQKDF